VKEKKGETETVKNVIKNEESAIYSKSNCSCDSDLPPKEQILVAGRRAY